jgi:hypothetical protein
MNMIKSITALVAVGGICLAHGQSFLPQGVQQWRAYDGEFSVFFHHDTLNGAGVSITNIKRTAAPSGAIEGDVTFQAAKPSNLLFQTKNAKLDEFITGTMQFEGGFTLNIKGKRIPFENFQVGPTGSAPTAPIKMWVEYKGTSFEFDIAQSMTGFRPETQQFMVGLGDILISTSMAEYLGQPWLAGEVVGGMHMMSNTKLVAGGNVPIPPIENGPGRAVLDLRLLTISGMSNIASSGTYPNGLRAVAMSTTSCNVGTITIPWIPVTTSIGGAMTGTNHPKIVQNMYRVSNGKFEQIGEGWLKHGFYAINGSSVCGSCTSPSGYSLGPGCADPYGTGNNSDRTYLGPRSEVNPLTGVWNPVGSFFSGYVPDNIRRTNGSRKWNGTATVSYSYAGIENRVVVKDTDLNVAGAEFYYESYYLAEGDENRLNNVAYRKCGATWSTANNRWNFSEQSASTIQGPAIDAWGDERADTTPASEGIARVAVKTTDVGSGRTAYDYAVYCHDIDRGIRSFKVPLESGLTVSNVVFRDPDGIAGNDWTWSYGGGFITFTGPTHAADPAAPHLSYGRVFNFRFEVNAAPAAARTIMMDYFKPGTNPALSATIKAPRATPSVNVSGIATFNGTTNATTTTATWSLTPNDTNASGSVLSGTTTMNIVSGAYSIPTNARGSFTLRVKPNLWLQEKVTPVTITSAGASVNLLIEGLGDIDGDNEVGPSDFEAVVNAFGTTSGLPGWNPSADLDGDGEVGPSDFETLVANFGMGGDN